jgi:catechol 2,3-dioxygenase-like lactoylglutathione lyase family enzyme
MKFSPEHIGLAASNPNTLKDWYMRVLGAKVVLQLGDSPPAYLLELAGGVWIEIYAADSALGPQPNKVAGWRHLALRVENIESARNYLAGMGVQFTEPVKPAGGPSGLAPGATGRILFFGDLEGNLLHLVERPASWMQQTG